MAAEPTSLFTSGTGLPLPAFTTPTALPPHGPAPPRGLEDRHGPHFLSQSSLFLLISCNPPGREGEGGNEGVLLESLHRSPSAILEEHCVQCPLQDLPLPQRPRKVASEQRSSRATEGNSLVGFARGWQACLTVGPTSTSQGGGSLATPACQSAQQTDSLHGVGP